MTSLNPVLRRELMERWRGRRAAATLTVYLTVLALILYALYQVGVALLESNTGFGVGMGGGSSGPALGRFLFEGLLFFVLLLVLFVSPGYAAAQLSTERERRTLPLLQVTLLRPSQIVLGKLGASVAWLTLLVVAALPLGATALFLGGVAVGELLRAVAFILVVAVGVAGIAIGISSLTRRTSAAVVLTYATVLALILGTVFAAGVEFLVRFRGAPQNATPVTLYANPFVGLADAATWEQRALGAGLLGFALPSPLSAIAMALPDGPLNQPPEEDAMVVGMGAPVPPLPGGVDVDGRPFDDEEPTARRPVWLLTGGLHLGLGALGLVVATRRVRSARAPARVVGGRRRRRRGALPAAQPSEALVPPHSGGAS